MSLATVGHGLRESNRSCQGMKLVAMRIVDGSDVWHCDYDMQSVEAPLCGVKAGWQAQMDKTVRLEVRKASCRLLHQILEVK